MNIIMDKTLSESIRNMNVGEERVFDIRKCQSIRAIASSTGLMLDRVYKTRTSREARVLIVRRVK